jgi:dTDP-4-amino-4,6-dideoxygalactose transaminase
MTNIVLDTRQPAALGGAPAFGEGLPLVRPTLEDRPELVACISAVLDSGVLTNGPMVRELESRVAERLGVDHVVAVASCTSGLALTLQALEATGPVVMPSFTFAASAHAVVWARGTPRFADIRADSLTLDPADATAALGEGDGPATAMTATHVYGTPCRAAELQAVADRAGVPLVYDAAHGLGSMHQGRAVGGFGTAEVFSLSPTKVVVGGEGGLVTTNNADLATAVRLGRDYGNPGNYDCVFPGLNARMSELHAATALHSLSRLDEHLLRRHELVSLFWDELADLPGLRGPTLEAGDVSTYKDLTVVLEDACGLSALELARALGAEGIDSRRYYSPPIHRQQAYRQLERRQLPITEAMADRVLSPPLWSHMSDVQMRRVALAVRQILSHAPAVRAAFRASGGGGS